jgi:hypothetical protein
MTSKEAALACARLAKAIVDYSSAKVMEPLPSANVPVI